MSGSEIPCDISDQTVTDFQSNHIHKKSHKTSTSAQAVKRKCPDCEETFSSRSHLTRHSRAVHRFINFNLDLMNPKPTIKPVICDHCDFKTKRKHYLKIHIEKQHSNEITLIIQFNSGPKPSSTGPALMSMLKLSMQLRPWRNF